jgi:hypothetical protein
VKCSHTALTTALRHVFVVAVRVMSELLINVKAKVFSDCLPITPDISTRSRTYENLTLYLPFAFPPCSERLVDLKLGQLVLRGVEDLHTYGRISAMRRGIRVIFVAGSRWGKKVEGVVGQTVFSGLHNRAKQLIPQ